MKLLIILLIIVVLCCLCSSFSGGVYYQIFVQENVPSFLPASMQFNKTVNKKLIGHTLQQYPDISENECLSRCLANPYCVGTTYDTKKQLCSIQWQNSVSRPTFISDWAGFNSYARIDPKNAVHIKQGFKSNSTPYKTNNAISLNDCIYQCIGKDPDCKAANFIESKKKCEYLDSNTDEGDTLTTDKNYSYFYRKGVVGNKCQKPTGTECIFGLCQNNICIQAHSFGAGEKCAVDSDCTSGKCLQKDRSFDEQEKEREDLLTKKNDDAMTCNSYTTCNDCQNKLVQGVEGESSALYSGRICEWRYSAPVDGKILESPCEEREKLLPSEVTGKCFPKTIKTTLSFCQ